MVDALLINPWSSGKEKYPPLSFIYLAAYAEQEGFSVEICDAAALEMHEEGSVLFLSVAVSDQALCRRFAPQPLLQAVVGTAEAVA